MRLALLSLGVAAVAAFVPAAPASATCAGIDVGCLLYCGPHVDPKDLKDPVTWVAC